MANLLLLPYRSIGWEETFLKCFFSEEILNEELALLDQRRASIFTW